MRSRMVLILILAAVLGYLGYVGIHLFQIIYMMGRMLWGN